MKTVFRLNRELVFYVFWIASLYAITIPPFRGGDIVYLLGALCFGGYVLLLNMGGDRLQISSAKYILFLLWIFFSALLNDALTYRVFTLAFLVVVSSPILKSRIVFEARERAVTLLSNSFVLIPFIAAYCFIYKINFYRGGWDPLNFAAIFSHPMQLSAFLGCADVVILWWILKTKSKAFKLLMIIVLFSSFFLGVFAASRSALIAAIISCVLLCVWLFRLKRSLPIVFILIAGMYFSSEQFFLNTEKIRSKIEAGQDTKYGSRTELWQNAYAAFRQSPIIGIGHSVSIINNEKYVGRIESGSGWLSVLFQTGIIGFALFLSIIFPSIKTIWKCRNEERLQLTIALFVFLLLHSIFEGYLLTFGNPMTWLFWLLQGHLVLYTYSK